MSSPRSRSSRRPPRRESSSPSSCSLSERCGLCGRPARSVGPACRRPRGAPRSQSSSWSPGSPASPARAPRSIAGFYGPTKSCWPVSRSGSRSTSCSAAGYARRSPVSSSTSVRWRRPALCETASRSRSGTAPSSSATGSPIAASTSTTGVASSSSRRRTLIAASARIAVANARLQVEVRRQVAELEASRRRVVEAADAQRRRLERELREGAERRLAEIEALIRTAERGANGDLAAMLTETQAKLDRTRSELHKFARGVHPRVLTQGGLPAALRDLADRSGVPVELTVPDVRLAAPVEAAAYFVCSEALANVDKYAAAAHAMIDVARRGATLVVSVRDDGRGGASLDEGSGLRGLADRVEALGGRFTIASSPGEGTRVVAELPLT